MSAKTRKIVFVWNYLNWGGAQIYFLGIMREAINDWDITVLLPKDSSKEFLSFLAELGIRYEFLENSLLPSKPSGLFGSVKRQFWRLRSEFEIVRRLSVYDRRSTVFHIECAPWQSWQLYALLSLSGANVFVTLHNFLESDNWIRRTIWKARLRFISLLPRFNLFTSNKDAKRRFRGWFTNAFHKTIRVTYTGVYPPQINEAMMTDRSVFRERFGFSESDTVVLSVGQFIDRKGRWVVLDAAKLVSPQKDSLKFVWLTPNPLSDEEELRIERYALGSAFRIILSSDAGSHRQEILQFFRIADVFVLPSYVEGLPIALLEAMALGIPAISTNVYGIPEAIENGINGYLIEPGDHQALAERIIELSNDVSLRRQFSEMGRKKVIAEFDECVASLVVLRSYARALRAG